MSRIVTAERKELIARVLAAGRENGTRSILFLQTVGQILGLSAAEMKCLDLIAHSGPAGPSQLAELTGLTTGAVTVLIDRLEKARLIERKADPHDRRRTFLMPTQRARKTIPPFYASMGKALALLASGYSNRELEILEDFFEKAADVFKKETAKLRMSREKA